MKQGILHKNTRIHTMSGMVLKVRRGTKVIATGGELTFNPVEGVMVFKLSGQYFVNLWGAVHQVVLPKGGRPNYPLSMI